MASLTPRPAMAQVDVAITADNAYTLAYGTELGLTAIVANVQNCTSAGEIFNCPGTYTGPELYAGVPAGATDYLYIIAYDDESVTQGVLAQLVSGANTTYSGAPSWKVYATGIDFDCGGGGPRIEDINAEIARANAGAGGAGSSVGWVTASGGSGAVGVLAVGEDNSSQSGTFALACTSRVGTAARWMWYNPNPSSFPNPFLGGTPGEYLIFRVPVTPTACSDGIDNDGDGCADYPLDTGCSSSADNSEAEGGCAQCSDGIDNDGDGCADYPLDAGCSGSADNSEAEGGCAQCSDGIDNDGNGCADYPTDSGCSSPTDNVETGGGCPQCSDGIDNDGDGCADYPADPGCSGPVDNSESPGGCTQCSDLIDNDGDGCADYPLDTGCSSPADNSEAGGGCAQCSDGIDNDGDGCADYPLDAGCSGSADNSEAEGGCAQCSDGIDNDGNGCADYPSDSGCSSPSDNVETGGGCPQCSDGIDNDGDGCADYPADPGCSGPMDYSEAPGGCTQCSDLIDNDGNGCGDYPLDSGCSSPADNSEAGGSCPPPGARAVPACPAAPRIRELRLCEEGPTCFSEAAMVDTVRYGGTVWAADSARWEAVRGGSWTFDTGFGSAINDGSNPNKPPGYHQSMEGWVGLDRTVNSQPYFSRSDQCAVSGSYSFWAGVNVAEATTLCYAGGAGYGNNWSLTIRKSFPYGGSGAVQLQFDYRTEAEPPYDGFCVAVDTTGVDAASPVSLGEFTGVKAGHASYVLVPGAGMRSDAGWVAMIFTANSDGAYSDEDGLFPTTCGLAAVDNVLLSGGIVDFSDFESSPQGWSQSIPTVGVGDYSDLLSLSDLPLTTTFCPCGLADSVLVFLDYSGGHPVGQDNLALSPWIDLAAGGDLGKPGHLVFYDVYAELPLANYVFPQIVVRSYPSVCPVTGLLTTSQFRESCSGAYFGEAPFCSAPDHPQAVDVSCLVGPLAEQVQIGVGVINLCGIAEFGQPCTGITNTTPWFDNISFGVYGSPYCPLVRTIPCERFQDNFAADGTLNPAAPGRIDVNHLKNRLLLATGAILGDTLVACGDGGNTEVRLVFRVTPGPFVNGAALGAIATRWTSEPALSGQYGGTWYSARMDTAQQGRQLRHGSWMTAFHEEDSGFRVADTSPDPDDRDRASVNDMIPDGLFTPGSRIDYFVTSRYLPIDPRNPGGNNWCTDPDTAGSTFFEVEVLPSSMAADSSWNCTLYVSHHGECESYQKYLEESGLTSSLGLGGNNFEGTRYDRYDRQGASPTQISFGRPLASRVGCSLTQAFAYRNIAWHSGEMSSRALTSEDAYILDPWLRLQALGGNRFWGSGSDLASSMHLGPATRRFLNNTLGVIRTCSTIRNSNCPPPGGTGTDPTTCMPTGDVGGAHFTSSITPFAGGSDCSSAGSFDLLAVNPVVGSAMGQLSYVKLGSPVNYMSISNWNTLDVDYKTVLDGAPVGRLRSDSFCADPGASLTRTSDVLTWFGSDLICRLRPGLVDVPAPTAPPAPDPRLTLGNAYPNPMTPRTRIPFLVGRVGVPVTLQIYDVTGRLVRTLASGPLAAGPHEVDWDGRTEDGSLAPTGLYFYRLSSADIVLARKLILMR